MMDAQAGRAGRAMAVVAGVTAPLAVIAPRGLAIALPLAAVIASFAMWRSGRIALPPRPLLAVVAAFLAWAGASVTWAVHPELVWREWAQIAGVALAGLVLLGVARDLDAESRRRVGTALVVGVVAALGLLALEWASGLLSERSLGARLVPHQPFYPTVFNRGVATIALLVWPAAYVLYTRGAAAAAAVLLAASLAIITQFESMAAGAGLVAGGAVAACAALRARVTAIALAAALVAGTAAAPLLPQTSPAEALAARRDVSMSIYHRVHIWRFTAVAIRERPALGWGLNASRDMPGGSDEAIGIALNLPLHPHNAVLQWWLELGAVGAGLGGALLLLAVFGAARLSPPAPAMGLALVACGAVMVMVGYGIWQAWWMSALWLAAILAASVAGDAHGPRTLVRARVSAARPPIEQPARVERRP